MEKIKYWCVLVEQVKGNVLDGNVFGEIGGVINGIDNLILVISRKNVGGFFCQYFMVGKLDGNMLV